MICIAMSKRVNKKLVVPTLKFVIKLQTYGIQISGEVPKLALIDSDAPKEIINNDIIYMIYLLIFFILSFMSTYFNLKIFKYFLGKTII